MQLQNQNIRWMQGKRCDGETIVRFENNTTNINESFEGHLQLNPHSGELTFSSITKNLAGSYCVRILIDGFLDRIETFFITVYGE